jgi:hypothetical protein
MAAGRQRADAVTTEPEPAAEQPASKGLKSVTQRIQVRSHTGGGRARTRRYGHNSRWHDGNPFVRRIVIMLWSGDVLKVAMALQSIPVVPLPLPLTDCDL